MLELVTWYNNPGILQSRMNGRFPTIMMIAHTPSMTGLIKVWHALMVKSEHPVANHRDIAAARSYQETSRLAFAQDFKVWANKRPAFNILQVPTDGPFHKARIWYSQFYNPRSKAADTQKRVNGIYTSKGHAPRASPLNSTRVSVFPRRRPGFANGRGPAVVFCTVLFGRGA